LKCTTSKHLTDPCLDCDVTGFSWSSFYVGEYWYAMVSDPDWDHCVPFMQHVLCHLS